MAQRPANFGKSNKPSRSKKSKKSQSLAVYADRSLGLSRSALPHSIVEVVGTLTRAGFEAYVVGGGVRDGMLGLAPKDFDAVTSARPHEIKAIFGGRCRIIGRRFQLAHVYSGRETIEVATFRAPPKDDAHTTDGGMIMRDNVWGDINQDFARRDFSINALYYQPIDGEVLDFCGAIDDIKSGTLRLLGDAKVRIEEDPVRLLRALRFKAKLDFCFDEELSGQFHSDNWALLEQVSAHRLYDETQKMFCGGYLASLLPVLFEYGAMKHLMAYAPDAPTALMNAVAINTDHRVSDGKGVNPAFFYAVLLWENYLHQLAKLKKKGLPFHEAQAKAATKVIDMQRQKTAIPKFAEDFIASIWLMQPKLANPRVRDITTLERHPKFRAALDFLIMREKHEDCKLSESTNGMAAWWQNYQNADRHHQAMMIESFANGGSATGMASRSRRKRVAINDELLQLHKLSASMDSDGFGAPEPLFVVENAKAFLPSKANEKDKAFRPHQQPSPPLIEPTTLTDADFLKLLENDEPYIPASRYRKRQPSSSLSIKEREQGLTEEMLSADAKIAKEELTRKSPKAKVVKSQAERIKTKAVRRSAKATTQSPKDDTPTKKRHRKSNAKPRAKES
ncbi:polynucleotide adenylyltransferase PcnB [Moraxella oculi]|uniref:Poly(A) polymerase I n=1 Tax=Moraxella oculi TaxID=2940516 RepID=A0ABW8UB75_9GAMM